MTIVFESGMRPRAVEKLGGGGMGVVNDHREKIWGLCCKRSNRG
jgi:hypothetical protein